ncbi:hypothetical protein B0H14DRAFT_2903647 [Mycena olivaceomarginata]|nr:hypothetical protein B0H14DRAFT_2903647 [Mycena olivaceomarginata]
MDEDGEVQGNDEDDDGGEYLPDAGDSSENEEEEMLPRFVKSVRKPCSLPPKALLQPQADTVQLPFFWVKNMSDFFYGQGDKPDSEIIVDDLVAMRHLKPEQYRTPAFLSTLETSGLFSLMREIARPGNLLETSHPDIEASFLDHDWKLSYSELICNWVEPTVSPEDYEKSQIPLKPDPEYFFDSSDAQDLLEFIEENPRMHPWGFNPMAAFVFYSLHCFRANCDRWLVPCLRELQYPKINGWNPDIVYRRLMALPVFEPGFNGRWPNPDSLLLLVVRETADHHAFLQRIRREAYRPSPAHHLSSSTNHQATPLPSLASGPQTAGPYLSASGATARSIPGPKLKLTSLNVLDTMSPGSLAPVSPLPPVSPPCPNWEDVPERNKNKQTNKKAQKTSAGQRAKHKVLGKKKRIGQHAYCAADNDDLEELDSEGLGDCPHCTNELAEEQCIRILYVKRRDCRHLIGGALTCAPRGQRLKPKPAPKPKDGSTPKPVPKIRYYNPFKDLKMDLVEFRETVYKRCGKDIVRFVWRRPDGTEEIVGGVRFKPFSEETLERLQQNHRLVKVTKIRRRGILERWAYGSMTGGGSRHPLKGAKGDGYGPYKIHRQQGSPHTNIKTCTREAVDADALVEIGNTIAPGMKAEITSLAVKSGVNFLGRTGLSNFTCTNYISCMHDDLDFSLEDFLKRRKKKKGWGALRPCAQLHKSHCGPDDYNFAYVQWGVVVRTMTNTVWVFNGRHVHATVMPSHNVQKRAESIGRHPTTPALTAIHGDRVERV